MSQVIFPAVVAVIDDHEIIGHGVRVIFERLAPTTKVVYVPSLRQLSVHPDVALLDLRLDDGSTPKQNLALLDARGVPTVVYTAGDSPYLVREAVSNGALAVLRKTATPRELVDTVAAAFRGEVTAGLDWAAAVDADEDFVLNRLSDTEAEVLAMYASGALAEAVARKLGVSPATVTTYVSRVRAKYRAAGREADSRIDLFRRAAEDGLISYYDPPR